MFVGARGLKRLVCLTQAVAAEESVRGVRQGSTVTSLRLFEIASEMRPQPQPPPRRSATIQIPADDVLHASERYLAEHVERYGDLAAIQAVLCLGIAPSPQAGDPEEAVIDSERFPRCIQAVARVRELLAAEAGELPEGFWPRFLLQQVTHDS
jgi:hypothetical protein